MAAVIFAFGEYELDTGPLELRHRGNEQPIEPQVYDVLAYLVDHRERVVTKEELLDNIWGDRFVSESALTSRIKSARRAVGDDGRTQAVIRTVHGRGYRFVARVNETQPAVASGGAPGAPVDLAPAISPAPADDGWPLLGRHDELEALARSFHDPDVGGVLLTGPAGMGKTRLAAEAVQLAGQAGLPIARAAGHAEARDLPLGCLAHMLPADVSSGVGLDGEMTRGALFQRARLALEERAQGQRLLLLVDDVDQADELSRALLSSLVMSGSAFLVLTQRTDDDSVPVLGNLVRNGHLQRVEVAPLDADLLGALLYRVLAGPIEARTIRQLLDASGGSPGVLRQLVESSLDKGALTMRHGVWTLDGEIVTTPDMAALVEERLDGLDDEHRRAVELLAMAGVLELDVAIELIDEEVLDALELRGLVALGQRGGRDELALAHPLFGEVLRGRMQQLRARRIRRALADAVEASGSSRPDDRLRLVKWRLDSGGDIDADSLLDAARLALYERDTDTAESLVGRLRRDAPSPKVVQLDAEVAFRRGRPERVEELLAGIDLAELDPTTLEQVVRRRATNLFYLHWEFKEALDLLQEAFEYVDGEHLLALESHWVMLATLAGYVGPAVSLGDRLLDGAEGLVRLGLVRALALGHALAGRLESGLDRVQECRELSASLPPSLSRPGRTLADFTEITAFIELGRLADAHSAVEVAAQDPTQMALGWLPYGSARLAICAGRPERARHYIEQPVELAGAMGLDISQAWLRSQLALAALLESDLAAAQIEVERMAPALQKATGLPRADMTEATAQVRAASGDREGAVDQLLEQARLSRAHGDIVMQGRLLHLVVDNGGASEEIAEWLGALTEVNPSPVAATRADYARAAVGGHAAGVQAASERFAEFGMQTAASQAARLA